MYQGIKSPDADLLQGEIPRLPRRREPKLLTEREQQVLSGVFSRTSKLQYESGYRIARAACPDASFGKELLKRSFDNQERAPAFGALKQKKAGHRDNSEVRP